MFDNMSDEELKKHYLSLYHIVFIVDCFGTRDVMECQAAEEELTKRGYEIKPGLPEIVRQASEDE